MEDIIKEIAAKAGINADQSKLALDTVLGLLKSKMPEALGGQLEGLLAGKELNLTSVIKEVSSEKLGDLKDSASEKLGDLKDSASEKLDDLKDSFKKLF